MFSKKSIGTHSGNFHCDEVLACAMLTRYTERYRDAEITRTRDLALLSKLDIVVDVGGVYDPSNERYDHHQKEFQDAFSVTHKIRLSSAGLIYKHFGREILRNVITEKVLKEAEKYAVSIDVADQGFLECVYEKLYDGFIMGVDAIDNGVSQFTIEGKSLEPNFSLSTGLEYRVGRLNPGWCEKAPDEMAKFSEAMRVADEELVAQVKGLVFSWWPARPIVQRAIEGRFEISKSGSVVKLERACPWKDHLTELEKVHKIEGKILFVLYPEGPSGFWRVQGINLKGSFALRKALKEEWRGETDLEKLRKTSGIEDIIFCHVSGFIGGAKSLESVVKMAELSLN